MPGEGRTGLARACNAVDYMYADMGFIGSSCLPPMLRRRTGRLCACWIRTYPSGDRGRGLARMALYPRQATRGLGGRICTPPSAFVEVAGIRLHVRDTGPCAAPAVIFLHGFGSSLQTWEDWARDLEADHRVMRYDLPGFGLTGADPSGDYTDRRSVEVLIELMDRLGVSRASIVGNSMGGRIAWTFAALKPERVDKLVLVSPDGFTSPGLEYGVKTRVPLLARLPTRRPCRFISPRIALRTGSAFMLTDIPIAAMNSTLSDAGQKLVRMTGQNQSSGKQAERHSAQRHSRRLWPRTIVRRR